MQALIVFAKYPLAGQVKTRLGAQIGMARAAELYRSFLERTFALCQQCPGAPAVFVAFEPAHRAAAFRTLVPPEFALFPQQGDDLGTRLRAAFTRVSEKGAQRMVALGSDSPTLPPTYLELALCALAHRDLALGPAEDGGYYLIGLRRPQPRLFEGIAWSTRAVFAQTQKRAAELGLSCEVLPAWYDIDDRRSLERAVRDVDDIRLAEEWRTYLPADAART